MEKEEIEDGDKCPRCEVNNCESMHTCPYAEEINGDSSSMCNCCSDCEYQCAMDI